jgi:thioredoxin-like negative regulator of GroEL
MIEQPAVLEATRDNFAQLVLANSRKGPVLVDFWAEWTRPSLRQRELLLRLAREYGGRFLHGMQTESDYRELIERHIVPLADRVQADLSDTPDRSETRFAVAAVHLMADDYGAALEELSELHRRDPEYRNGLPRRALLVVFDLLGPEDERTRRYRQMLFDR